MDTVCRKPLKLPPLRGDNISICLIVDGGGYPLHCAQNVTESCPPGVLRRARFSNCREILVDTQKIGCASPPDNVQPLPHPIRYHYRQTSVLAPCRLKQL